MVQEVVISHIKLKMKGESRQKLQMGLYVNFVLSKL